MSVNLSPDTPVEIGLRRRNRRIVLAVFSVLYLIGLWAWFRFGVSEAEEFVSVEDHFKYGSIGSDNRENGLPQRILDVLPYQFPDHMPRPLDEGERGLEPFGFLYEESRDRPIGFSRRRLNSIPTLGLNCAACHTGTYRTSEEAQPTVVLGMPSHQLDLQAFFRFLFDCAGDSEFTTDRILAAIEEDQPLGFLDRQAYRFFVIPQFKSAVLDKRVKLEYWERFPDNGPGRIDTFGPYCVLIHDIDPPDAPGCADFPALWNQGPRKGMQLHWDGNNDSVFERNLSASMGAGCTPETVDLDAVNRIRDWSLTLRPAERFPTAQVDQVRAARGAEVYREYCAECHDFGAARTGRVEPIEAIGTDRSRWESFYPLLAERMNTIGTGYPWKFERFRRTEGYANVPLDDVWLKAPYLHNGSVPTLWDLLLPPNERPKSFVRGYDLFDFDKVGFVTNPSDEGLHYRFDTSLHGNSNSGHEYGTHLPESQRRDLLEYLKLRDSNRGQP